MKAVTIVGAVIVLGLLAVTVPTTVQLTKLDVGMRSSVASTSRLAHIESTIIQKNKSLQTLIDTAAAMNLKLRVTAATPEQLQKNIDAINQLNRQTLQINQSIGGQAGAGAGNLGQIAGSLKKLDQSMSQLRQSLTALDGIVQQDANNMGQMKQATHAMNNKIPGVTG